jgi:Sap-like sulfolipid-1-addressing protein
MGALLASVLPLAAGAAISPTLLALQLLVLAGPTHRLARAWALAAGAAAVLALYAVLGVTLLRQIHTRSAPHHSLRDALIELVGAGLLVALALRTRLRRPTAAEAHGSRASGRLDNASLPWFVGAGGLGMLTNFSTLVLFLPALHQIERAQVGTAGRAVAFALLYVITLLPVLLPVGAATVMGRRAEPALDRIHVVISRHSRQIAVTIELVFAAYLAWKGVGELP